MADPTSRISGSPADQRIRRAAPEVDADPRRVARDPLHGEVEVTVRYFAAAAEAAGTQEERLRVAPTAGALRALLMQRYGPAMARVLAAGSLLVDGVVTRDPARPLVAHVDVLPPFAGG